MCYEFSSISCHSQTTLTKDGEASKITYLHNAAGQRFFKSEPQAAQYQPNEAVLGTDFIAWLKSNFSWLFATAQANASQALTISLPVRLWPFPHPVARWRPWVCWPRPAHRVW